MATPVLSKIVSAFKSANDNQKEQPKQKETRPVMGTREKAIRSFVQSCGPRVRNGLRVILLTEEGQRLLKVALGVDQIHVLTEAERKTGLARRGQSALLFHEMGFDVTNSFVESVDLSTVTKS